MDTALDVGGRVAAGKVVRVEAVKTANAAEASVWLQEPDRAELGSATDA